MKSFVTANLSHHPGRTVASIFGVALGIILVLLTVGFVRGALRERGLRETNTGIELLVYHKDQAGLTVTSNSRRIKTLHLSYAAIDSRRHTCTVQRTKALIVKNKVTYLAASVFAPA